MNFCSRLTLVLFFVAVSGIGRAVELVGIPRVEAKEASAIVRWTTNSESGSQVRFGTEAGQLLRKAVGPGVGTVHVVMLDSLQPGTSYFFSVGTSRKLLATGDFRTMEKPSTKGVVKPAEISRATPASVRRSAPATKRIWGNPASLVDHFDRHGHDFGAKNPDDYARLSWVFLQRALDEGLPAKVDDGDGTIRVWDPKTRAFAAYNRDGTTKTYFKPGSADYFARQPGRPTKLKRKE